ncbi:heparinase II/III domain-containing protein [Kribbella jejuensis]|uniref:heparinase II/III domain-containing protein n=1 Tax=Kribbella jejuensis TaxID=236068 RepID=UPI0011530563|nr:heparinase II/III family protein [Kribbella jejuensis]
MGRTVALTLACVLVCGVAFAGAVFVLMPGTRAAPVSASPTPTNAPPPPTPTPTVPESTDEPLPGVDTPATPPPSTPVANTGTYECPGYSGIQVPVPMLLTDTFAWGDDPPYKVGDGTGNINWRSNPYQKPSWYMWLHSLRWLGSGIEAGARGDRKALDHVMAIIHDWVRDNPYSWKGDVGAWEATMHRTNVLLCARQAILTGQHVSKLPTQYAWLDKALVDHAQFMIVNWSGRSNHGTDESIALYGVGCTLKRPELKTLAVNRLTEAITTAIDAQGSTNEQSVGYAMFNYLLWGRATTALQRCGSSPGTVISQRRAALSEWLALATKSTGELQQVGDAVRQKPTGAAGTALDYVASLGKHGTKPGQRVAVFDAGYIFGRTGWGETRPFAQESTYSIRYGAARTLHGHDDHTSITYSSHGRDILIDPGHSGYQLDKWQAWSKSAAAHNMMTIPSADTTSVATQLTRASITPTWESYSLADSPAPGITRKRDVLVLKDPDLIITLDRGQATSSQRYETLWHLAPGQQVTVQSPTSAIATSRGAMTYLLQIPYRQQPAKDGITVVEGQQDPVQGWYYPDIFHRESAPVVKFSRNGTDATILSAIVPTAPTEAVTYRTRTVAGMYFVDLTVGARTTTIRITQDGRLTRIN